MVSIATSRMWKDRVWKADSKAVLFLNKTNIYATPYRKWPFESINGHTVNLHNLYIWLSAPKSLRMLSGENGANECWTNSLPLWPHPSLLICSKQSAYDPWLSTSCKAMQPPWQRGRLAWCMTTWNTWIQELRLKMEQQLSRGHPRISRQPYSCLLIVSPVHC